MLPYYLISASYLSHCLLHDNWNVSQNMQYHKRYKLNRCTIAASQGPLSLSVPLLNGRNQKKILNEVQIDYRHKWNREHINSLKTVYGKAPFFMYYFDAIHEILMSHEFHLLSLNVRLMNSILEALHFTQRVEIKAEMSEVDEQDISSIQCIEYNQLFQERTGFIPQCTVLDLIFNHGPDSKQILLRNHGLK
jgi:hypothetical protein